MNPLNEIAPEMMAWMQQGRSFVAQIVEILLSLDPDETRTVWFSWRPMGANQREGRIRWLESIHTLFLTASDEDARALLAVVGPVASVEAMSQAWAALQGRLSREVFFATIGRPCQPVDITWRAVPGGVALMGADRSAADQWERPRHPVDLDAFQIAATPITRAQQSLFRPELVLTDEEHDLPAGSMSWCEAWLLCEWLGAKLPTEAQWERACRAGTTSRWSCGNNPAQLGTVAWMLHNSGGRLHRVGQKVPNSLGLYDMHGNVFEWCADPQRPFSRGRVHSPGEEYQSNGQVDRGAVFRSVRGGYYVSTPQRCRSAYRGAWSLFSRFDGLGVRPVRFE